MKKGVIISLALASLLLVGCDNKGGGESTAATQERAVTEATHQAAAKTQAAQQSAAAAEQNAADSAQAAAAAANETAQNAAETAAEATKEAAAAATEAAKDAASEAVDAAKEKADEAKAAVESAKEEAAAAATTATAAAAAATSETESTAANIDAAKLYATKCASCHGPKGERKALGKSAPIGGMAKDEVLEKLKGYKAGTLNLYGMGALMKTQVASLSDAELEALAAYISTLK